MRWPTGEPPRKIERLSIHALTQRRDRDRAELTALSRQPESAAIKGRRRFLTRSLSRVAAELARRRAE